MNAHAILVTPALTYVDSNPPRTTPAVTGLPELLDRVAATFTGTGVVLLDADMAGKLELPTAALPSGDQARRHAAAIAARANGWATKEIHRWSHFTKAGKTVHVGLLEFIDQCPLVSPYWPQDTTAAFAAWHRLTGHPFAGNAGDAFNAIAKATAKPRIDVKGRKTTVTPAWWSGARGPDSEPLEATFRRSDWEFDQPGRYLHGYDLVRAYLAAIINVEVPVLALRPGPHEFDPKLGGWWRVELAPWNVDTMPNPAGYQSGEHTTTRWLTTPTLRLINELVAEGVHGGFTVTDAWVSVTSRAVLRPAAEILRDAYNGAGLLDNEQDRDAVRAAVKDAYRRCHGMWRSRQSEIQRPDWAHSVAAMCRANLWRKCWKAGRTTGRWPTYLAGIDTAWYASDHADPWQDPPAGFRNEDTLGGFAAKGFIDRGTK